MQQNSPWKWHIGRTLKLLEGTCHFFLAWLNELTLTSKGWRRTKISGCLYTCSCTELGSDSEGGWFASRVQSKCPIEFTIQCNTELNIPPSRSENTLRRSRQNASWLFVRIDCSGARNSMHLVIPFAIKVTHFEITSHRLGQSLSQELEERRSSLLE